MRDIHQPKGQNVLLDQVHDRVPDRRSPHLQAHDPWTKGNVRFWTDERRR